MIYMDNVADEMEFAGKDSKRGKPCGLRTTTPSKQWHKMLPKHVLTKTTNAALKRIYKEENACGKEIQLFKTWIQVSTR